MQPVSSGNQTLKILKIFKGVYNYGSKSVVFYLNWKAAAVKAMRTTAAVRIVHRAIDHGHVNLVQKSWNKRKN